MAGEEEGAEVLVRGGGWGAMLDRMFVLLPLQVTTTHHCSLLLPRSSCSIAHPPAPFSSLSSATRPPHTPPSSVAASLIVRAAATAGNDELQRARAPSAADPGHRGDAGVFGGEKTHSLP